MKKLLLIPIALILGACSQKSPVIKKYTFNPLTTEVNSSKYNNKTIKVYFPQSLKAELSEKIQYSYSYNEVGFYEDSQWSVNLGKLLQGSVIENLERTNMFKAVLPYTSTVLENYRLESTIYDFSHHIRDKESYAIVSIQFSLINTNTGILVKTKRFNYKEDTSTFDAAGYVSATNKAIDKLNRDLINWL